jgi:hypothetical protein
MKTIENEFGETWIEIEDDNLKKTIIDSIPVHKEKFQTVINYLAKVDTDTHYIVSLYMGENGSGKWENYFAEMLGFVKNMKSKGYNIWLIDWKNDCLDDVSTVCFGLRENK